jgi:deoxyadenosine/deoxycytidine kinase
MLIAVAGLVGTGKTTLTQALARDLGLPMALESVDAAERPAGEPGEANPWLALFYGGEEAMRRFALPLQLHFLATRMEALRRMRAEGGDWVLDRTWYEDAEIFARGLYEEGKLSPMEWDLYRRLYTELSHLPAARPPRLLVYLQAPLELVIERIRGRGRLSEREVPAEYWAGLHRRYTRWIGGFRLCPVLTLDVRDYDLRTDPRALERLVARVERALGRRLAGAGVQYRLGV